MDSAALDNPAWSALTGRHAYLAQGRGAVLRYPADVSPFAAFQNAAALPGLADLLAPGDNAVLWSPGALEAPAGLELVIRFPCLQMAAETFRPAATEDDALALTARDAAEMVELAALTRPGPFHMRTLDMGDYIGVRVAGRLAAMAGERMKPDGFTEISAICTHPDFQGRGHARRLTSIMGRRIVASGRVPFLNVLPENAAAIALYDGMGFRPRRMMQVHLLRRPGGDMADDAFFSRL